MKSQLNLIVFLTSLTSIISFSSCQQTSQDHYAQKPQSPQAPTQIPKFDPIVVKTQEWVTLDSGNNDLTLKPQADILFVIDDSVSMKQTQAQLTKNINEFTKSFLKNNHVDFRIAVTTNWDHYTESFSRLNPQGPGQLKVTSSGKPFLSRSDKNLSQELPKLLNVGTRGLALGGAEHEAFFTPLLAVLENSQQASTDSLASSQSGFVRKGAHLFIIIVSDADDMSVDMTPGQAARRVIELKNESDAIIKAYGVLVSKNDPDAVKDHGLKKIPGYHPECFEKQGKGYVDNGLCPDSFGPERLESFINELNQMNSTEYEKSSSIFRLTQPKFGQYLGQMGLEINNKVLHKEISLQQKPSFGKDYNPQIKVSYKISNKSIPLLIIKDWIFQADLNKIIIQSSSITKLPQGGVFEVSYLPVTVILK